jgi:transcriptional regulator with XRE-family HTH domain
MNRQVQKLVNPCVTHRKAIGENIRTLRRAKGWTQETLARKTKMDSGYLSTLELGQVTISVDNLLKIAHALKTPISELIKGVE